MFPFVTGIVYYSIFISQGLKEYLNRKMLEKKKIGGDDSGQPTPRSILLNKLHLLNKILNSQTAELNRCQKSVR